MGYNCQKINYIVTYGAIRHLIREKSKEKNISTLLHIGDMMCLEERFRKIKSANGAVFKIKLLNINEQIFNNQESRKTSKDYMDKFLLNKKLQNKGRRYRDLPL